MQCLGPRYLMELCPRTMVNKIFDWQRYNRFIFVLSVPFIIDSESESNVLSILGTPFSNFFIYFL